MDPAIQVFMAYAAAFEESYADDDWSRIEQYFADDARYTVSGGPFACEIDGRAAVIAGLKKSLDGFDRHFDHREIELTSGPVLAESGDGHEIRMTWNVHYQKAGAPNVILPGSSVVQVLDGQIQHLTDVYVDEELAEIGAWLAAHGDGLDGSYV